MANRTQYIDFLGTPSSDRASGTAEFYATGTSTPKTVYGASNKSDSKIIASFDSKGAALVWGEGVYDIIVKSSSGATLYTITGYNAESYRTNVSTKTGNYTVITDDDVILVDASGGVVIITLYDCALATHGVIIKKIDASANAVTVGCYAAQTIDGNATVDITAQNSSITLYSDGTQWRGADSTILASDSSRLNGQLASYYLNSSNQSSGTLPDARLTFLYSTSAIASGVPKADASGKIDNGWLKTGAGNGLDADKLEGQHGTWWVPSGAIMSFGANAAPTGWLECDGAAVSRTTYSALFAAIGTTWGVGDGSSTFNVPDFRGEFLRGWDHAKGTDSGRAFASSQADALKAHTHTIAITAGTGATSQLTPTATQAPGTQATSSTGDAETRPRNIAVMFIIKT